MAEDRIGTIEAPLGHALESGESGLCQRIEAGKPLSAADRERLEAAIRRVLMQEMPAASEPPG